MGTINLNQLTIFHNVSDIEKSNAQKFADGILFLPRIAFGYEKLKVTNQNGVTDKLIPIIEKTRSLCLRIFLGFVAFTVMLPLTCVAIIIKACLMKSQMAKTVSLLKSLQKLQQKASEAAFKTTADSSSSSNLAISLSLESAPIVSEKNLELRLATACNSKQTLFNNAIKNILGSFLNVREFGRLRSTCYLGSQISPITYLHYTPNSMQEMLYRTYGDLPSSGIWNEAVIKNCTKLDKIDLSMLPGDFTVTYFPHVSSLVCDLQCFTLFFNPMADWSNLTEITDVGSSCQIDLQPSIFANQKLKKLTAYDFSKWEFPEEERVKLCPALEELNCTLRESANNLPRIGQFASLKKLILNANDHNISNQLGDVLTYLPLLQELSLKGNRYQAEDFAALLHAPSLTSLEIDATGFWDNTIASLKTVSDSLIKLKKIELKILIHQITNLQKYNDIIQQIDLLSSIKTIDKIHISCTPIDTPDPDFAWGEGSESTKEQVKWAVQALAYLLKKLVNKVVSLDYDNFHQQLDTPILPLLSSMLPLVSCKIFKLVNMKISIRELMDVLMLMPNLKELSLRRIDFIYEENWADVHACLPIRGLDTLRLEYCNLSSEFMQKLAISMSQQLHVLSLADSNGFVEEDLKLILEKGNFVGLNLNYLRKVISDKTISTLVEYQKNLVALSLKCSWLRPNIVSVLSNLTPLFDLTSLMALDLNEDDVVKSPLRSQFSSIYQNSRRPAMRALLSDIEGTVL